MTKQTLPGKRAKSPLPLKDNQFYFSGNVPSLKNGKDIFCKDRRGKNLKRALVLPNSFCSSFLIGMAPQQVELYSKWIELTKPWGEIKDLKGLVLLYQFIRPSPRSVFDYSNAVEILQDSLTGKVYQTQSKKSNALKYTDRVKNMPNLMKYLTWIPEDNNTRVLPAFHPEVLYNSLAPGVIITVFNNFKEYVDFLVLEKIGT